MNAYRSLARGSRQLNSHAFSTSASVESTVAWVVANVLVKGSDAIAVAPANVSLHSGAAQAAPAALVSSSIAGERQRRVDANRSHNATPDAHHTNPLDSSFLPAGTHKIPGSNQA